MQQKELSSLEEEHKKRMYVIPVRDLCNANCTFCYMHEKKRDFSKPQFIDVDKLEKLVESVETQFSETELTGGGDPSIHPRIEDIIDIFTQRQIYTKMYTNGLVLKDIPFLDEINISRVHWDSDINQKFYRANKQRELIEILEHYRPRVKKLRIQTILLRGAIDSEEKIREFVSRYENIVDVFMFRTLFPSCSLEKDKFVDYPNIEHPKVKFDTTLDNYDRPLFFVNTRCELGEKFDYS